MRKICYTSLRRRVVFATIGVLLLVLVVAAFVALIGLEPNIYDDGRTVGVPGIEKGENGYTSYSQEGVCSVALCCDPEIDGKLVYINLTNPSENDVLIRAEIYESVIEYDDDGSVKNVKPGALLGMSGFIAPGEYVHTVSLDKALPAGQDKLVSVKIATYIEDNGMSNGYFYVNTEFHT